MAVAGRVLMIPAGVWKSGTSYGMLDVVIHNGSSYVAKKQINNSTVAPPSASSDWQLLAQGFDATNMVTKSMIVNDLLTTNPNTVLSGPMGKSLKDQLDTLNSNLTDLGNNKANKTDVHKLFGVNVNGASLSNWASDEANRLSIWRTGDNTVADFPDDSEWCALNLQDSQNRGIVVAFKYIGDGNPSVKYRCYFNKSWYGDWKTIM